MLTDKQKANWQVTGLKSYETWRRWREETAVFCLQHPAVFYWPQMCTAWHTAPSIIHFMLYRVVFSARVICIWCDSNINVIIWHFKTCTQSRRSYINIFHSAALVEQINTTMASSTASATTLLMVRKKPDVHFLKFHLVPHITCLISYRQKD